jgi:hypothetical protein
MATENPTWGYTRIRGGLKRLGHAVARNTIKAILNDHGIEPAPERGTKTPWKTFLAAHWDLVPAHHSNQMFGVIINGLYLGFLINAWVSGRGTARRSPDAPA